ncbi:hypothetical protein M436DRAFT_74455 [Aureobasidium namibiae CBS 147.97]|uniref:Uncharacterized protein n=1 Tax=Aureobasidium namibiae CBS 147.97 TaxID=1043004 RepID=A0A074WID7_9PEZI
MDARNTDIVTQRLHHLLARLFAENFNSSSPRKQNPPTSAYNRPASYHHHIDMGVRGSDDYLTARAANPRTGLISPSVVTNLTPRTPISPAEALSLFGSDHILPSDSSPRVRAIEEPRSASPRQRPAGPRGRWRQDSTGWNMELDTEAGCSKITTANSSATRADFHASEDSFVIPMPTAKDPQPYQQADQDKAVQYYKDKAQRLSHKEGMNGRMHSIGAGPRKFAQATKALRDFSNPRSSSPKAEDSAAGHDASSPPISAFPGFAASCESPCGSPRPTRKSVHSPAPELERRDSGVSVSTSSTAREKTALADNKSPTIGGAERTRSNSNTSRFQDLRQLPRVRVVHPDGLAAKGHHEKAVPREYTSTPPPPYMSHSNTPSISGASMAESLSPLETQVVGFLAWAINQMFCKPTPSRRDGSPQGANIGLTQAIHILSDSATKPIERWQAIKSLVLMAVRAIAILCCLAIVVRIGTAVGRVLAIMLWPVSIVWVIVKWMVGLG